MPMQATRKQLEETRKCVGATSEHDHHTRRLAGFVFASMQQVYLQFIFYELDALFSIT